MNRINPTAAVAITAGLACSIATARAPVADGVAIVNQPAIASAGAASAAQAQPVLVDPTFLIVNGRRVPFALSDELPSGVTDIQPRVAYDNYTNVQPAPAPSGLFSATTATNDVQAVLDDIVLQGGAGNIYALRFGFSTSATIAPNASFAVGWTWYNSFNAAATGATPVNGSATDSIFVAFTTPPAAGWATGTSYGTRWVTSDTVVDVLAATSPVGAIEFNAVPVSATGLIQLQPFTDVGPTFNTNPPVIGSSPNPGVWTNGNNITSGTFFNPPRQFQLGNPPAPVVSNLRLALAIADPPSGSFGACCLPNQQPQSCVVLRPTQCANNNGVYRGDGTNCALTIATACTYSTSWGSPGGIIWSNGPITTGTQGSVGGTLAPVGGTWSEGTAEGDCQSFLLGIATWNDAGGLAVTGDRLLEDFTVPAGESWTVNNVALFLYAPDGGPGIVPTDQIIVDLYRGTPGTPGFTLVTSSGVVNVDTSNATFTNSYAVFTGGTYVASRGIWEIRVPINAANLTAGQYWIAWAHNGDATINRNFSPLIRVWANPTQTPATGVLSLPLGNAQAFTAPDAGSTAPGFYSSIYEGNLGSATCLPYSFDLPFLLRGSRTSGGPTTCYANCDNSTIFPVLNAIDFSCFLNRYRAGDPYANCDASTIFPTLNAIDFSCFLNRYRSPEAGTNCVTQ